MGIAIGDVDADGFEDIFVTHLSSEQNVCWKQGPAGLFQDETGQLGLPQSKWRGTGFGTLFGDFDQDGALDLAVANGAVKRRETSLAGVDPASFWRWYLERNQLFANDGTGKFRDISLENEPFCGGLGVSRGLAAGDFDGDGALDLLVTRIADSARLYRNTAPARGHGLSIRVTDPALGGRDAYGAIVKVRAGNRQWIRQVNPGYSYACSNTPWVHVGLGSANTVEWIEVLWPDGSKEQFPGGPADRTLNLRKGTVAVR
jgi:hypothetical protein